jgi:hypothetical protein
MPEAEETYREAIALSETAAGPESVYRILAIQGLGNAARAAGRLDAAARFYADAEARAARQLRPDHRYVRRLQRDRALLQIRAGQAGAALQTLNAVSESELRILPRPHPEHGQTLLAMGRAHIALNDAAAARAVLREALDDFVRLPDTHPHVRAARALLDGVSR